MTGSTTMKGLVHVGGPDGVQLQDCPIPKITQPDQVLVRVEAAGICGTDLHVIKGNFPMPLNVIIGHESAGTIVETGSSCKVIKVGDRVGVNPVKGCETCRYCTSGRPNLCKDGGLPNYMGLGSRNGALTQYLVTKESLVVKIPDDLPFETAVLAETTSTVIRAVDQMKPLLPDSEILVLGGGITGNLAAMLLTHEGRIGFTICQRSEARRQALREQYASFGVKVKSPDELEADYEANKGDREFGFDVILEATGNTKAVENCVKYLRFGGKLVIFGCCPSTEKMSLAPFEFFWKELTVVGSLIQPNTYERSVETIVSLYNKRRLSFDDLMIKKFNLSEYKDALKVLDSKKISKAICFYNYQTD